MTAVGSDKWQMASQVHNMMLQGPLAVLQTTSWEQVDGTKLRCKPAPTAKSCSQTDTSVLNNTTSGVIWLYTTCSYVDAFAVNKAFAFLQFHHTSYLYDFMLNFHTSINTIWCRPVRDIGPVKAVRPVLRWWLPWWDMAVGCSQLN